MRSIQHMCQKRLRLPSRCTTKKPLLIAKMDKMKLAFWSPSCSLTSPPSASLIHRHRRSGVPLRWSFTNNAKPLLMSSIPPALWCGALSVVWGKVLLILPASESLNEWWPLHKGSGEEALPLDGEALNHQVPPGGGPWHTRKKVMACSGGWRTASWTGLGTPLISTPLKTCQP